MTKYLRVSLWAAVAVFALTAGSTTSAASSPRPQDTASLSGTAIKSTGQAMPNVTVQVRELETGRLAATTMATETGTFSFAGLRAGQYVVEMVDAAGQVIGTSGVITVAATPVTGLSLVESRERDAAGVSTASSGSRVKTVTIITSAAAAAAVVTAVTVAGSASPSR